MPGPDEITPLPSGGYVVRAKHGGFTTDRCVTPWRFDVPWPNVGAAPPGAVSSPVIRVTHHSSTVSLTGATAPARTNAPGSIPFTPTSSHAMYTEPLTITGPIIGPSAAPSLTVNRSWGSGIWAVAPQAQFYGSLWYEDTNYITCSAEWEPGDLILLHTLTIARGSDIPGNSINAPGFTLDTQVDAPTTWGSQRWVLTTFRRIYAGETTYHYVIPTGWYGGGFLGEMSTGHYIIAYRGATWLGTSAVGETGTVTADPAATVTFGTTWGWGTFGTIPMSPTTPWLLYAAGGLGHVQAEHPTYALGTVPSFTLTGSVRGTIALVSLAATIDSDTYTDDLARCGGGLTFGGVRTRTGGASIGASGASHIGIGP